MKSTLLLTASGPGLKGVGGVLIGDMLSAPGVDKVSLVALVHAGDVAHLDMSRLQRLYSFSPPAEFQMASPGSVVGLLRKIGERQRHYKPAVKRLARQVLSIVNQEKPDQIWAILNSTAVIDVLDRVMKHYQGELLTQIWDDPMHLAGQRNLDRFTRRNLHNRFHAILRRSRRIAVICEEMAAAYADIHAGEYVIVRHGLNGNVAPRTEPSNPSEFRIGLSGSMYSPASWKALQQALDHLQWRLDNRQVVLNVVGGKIEFVSRSTAECRFWGWRPSEEATRIMAECDLLYLPQAFEGGQRPLTQYSFPTKLSAYVTTGRPILIHTPEYGSLTRFCRQHDAGILCHSLEADEVARVLRQCEDPDFRSRHAAAAVRIGATVLTRDAFYGGVRAFLGAA